MTNKIPSILILLISLAELSFVALGLYGGTMAPSGTVPILNWDSSMTYLIFWVGIPLFGSIIAVLLIPRILTPLFMRIKKLLRRGYSDGYVDTEISPLNGGKMIMRLVYIYLLVIGLLTTLSSFLDPLQFLPTGGPPSPIDPLYDISFIFCIAGIAAPISVALWSVGWTLEDAGLLHYNLPSKDSGKLYEIEPVFRSYTSYLKGFASFSTVFSLIVIYNYFLNAGYFFDAISVFLVPFHAMLITVPAYFLFSAIGSKWLRKNKRVLKQLEDTDISLYAE